MITITWNVLYRYYYEKYKKYTKMLENINEPDRLINILEILKNLILKDKEIIMFLQEVPGDLLSSILENMSDYNIYFTEFVRVPKKYGDHEYKDPKEYLVTIISKSLGEFTMVEKKNKNRGYFILKKDNLYVGNAHLPIDEKLRLDFIKNLLLKYQGEKIILGGDFNTKIYEISNLLNNFSYVNKCYDYVVSNYLKYNKNEVINSKNNSDHQILIGHIV